MCLILSISTSLVKTKYSSHCHHRQPSNDKKNSSDITNQRGRNRYFCNQSSSRRDCAAHQLHINSQYDTPKHDWSTPPVTKFFCFQVSTKVLHQALFLCQVLVLETTPCANGIVLLILMTGNILRIGFLLTLLITIPNHPAINTIISSSCNKYYNIKFSFYWNTFVFGHMLTPVFPLAKLSWWMKLIHQNSRVRSR